MDAARYFFVMRSADSHLDFDMDLAKEQSSENPVYYVQYAHARICSILRQAEAVPSVAQVDCSLLRNPAELALIQKIAELPGEIAYAASHLEPHRLAFYANELATLFHGFYTTCRVLIRPARLEPGPAGADQRLQDRPAQYSAPGGRNSARKNVKK